MQAAMVGVAQTIPRDAASWFVATPLRVRLPPRVTNNLGFQITSKRVSCQMSNMIQKGVVVRTRRTTTNMIPKEVVRTTRTTRIKVAEADLEMEGSEWKESEWEEDEKPQRPLRSVVERFNIHHEKNVSVERLKELGVSRWSKWDCGPGVTYTWHWKVDEQVYISKGSVEVVPDGCSDGVFFYAGDVVCFPKWFEASLTFDEDYEQHYKFLAYGD